MTPKAVLVLALLATAGCRADGGIDRLDNRQCFEFTKHCLVTQTNADIAATRAWFTSIPGTLSRSTAESAETLRNTLQLYVDAHEAR